MMSIPSPYHSAFSEASRLSYSYEIKQQHTHMSSSYRSSRLGLSLWDPYAMHRGGCLELYYCNMVEWSWWDSSLVCKTNWFPSVLWHCWFGHMTCKNRPDMTCNVFGGTLNLAHSIKVCPNMLEVTDVLTTAKNATVQCILWRRPNVTALVVTADVWHLFLYSARAEFLSQYHINLCKSYNSNNVS